MQRISDIEKRYVLEALNNSFATSKNSYFTTRLERSFAQQFGSPHALAFANGTATLHAALHALGVKSGDEVIVPPLTMSSPAISVLHCGAIPIFADVDPDTFTISPKAVEKLVTKKTKAVMSVALYGLPPDYDGLLDICERHGLPLIEDNAQCFLGTHRGKLAGTFGACASFSFQSSKHLTCGEGGLLLVRDTYTADEVRRFSSLGYAAVGAESAKISKSDILSPTYARHVSIGFNYRMSEVQAAVMLGQLERIEELVQVRVQAASLFSNALAGQNVLIPQAVPEHQTNSYWAFAASMTESASLEDWFVFRDFFAAEGGDDVYAAWRLSYFEPLFVNKVQHFPGIWQQYAPGLCPVAEYLQPRLFQFKTNYWKEGEAARQAEILRRALDRFVQGGL